MLQKCTPLNPEDPEGRSLDRSAAKGGGSGLADLPGGSI